MRCRVVEGQWLYVRQMDLPSYKRGGSVVRNSYFWALRSIADATPRDRDWPFEAGVWVALARMLTAFAESGYLGYTETLLECPPNDPIPEVLRSVATWGETADLEDGPHW